MEFYTKGKKPQRSGSDFQVGHRHALAGSPASSCLIVFFDPAGG